jgi:type IV secretory pathway protease TraF
MTYRVVTSRAEAAAVEQTQDKLLGYPRVGVHVGGGVHVAMPATWDGTGSVPVGWTSYRGSGRQHPVRQEFAVLVDPECTAALANGRRARLTAQEQTKMAADVAAAIELPADWSPAGLPAQETKETGGRT